MSKFRAILTDKKMFLGVVNGGSGAVGSGEGIVCRDDDFNLREYMGEGRRVDVEVIFVNVSKSFKGISEGRLEVGCGLWGRMTFRGNGAALDLFGGFERLR